MRRFRDQTSEVESDRDESDDDDEYGGETS